MNIVICGGGGLGHTCSAVLSTRNGIIVNLMTNHPESWNKDFIVNTPDGGKVYGLLNKISSSPKDLITDADIVLLCLPAFLVEETIEKIQPYLRNNTILGSVFGSTGFFLFAHKHLSSSTKLFAFQRVPYISRVVEYGKIANLHGYRDKLIMATENIEEKEEFQYLIEDLFNEPVELCESFYEVTLSNSNPILHTGRLYSMWHDWDGTPFSKCNLFYHDWTDDASHIDIEMDNEFFHLLKVLDVRTTHIETLLEHYESVDAASMTAKLQNIPSLSTILSPMIHLENGWVPDFNSRYFTEDFPFGLNFIYNLAKERHIDCPHIKKVYKWGMDMVNSNTNSNKTNNKEI